MSNTPPLHCGYRPAGEPQATPPRPPAGKGGGSPSRRTGLTADQTRAVPERIVGAAIEDETLTRTGRSLGDLASEHVAAAALDAVRGALNSDDPAVVRAMAERIGLTVDDSREYDTDGMIELARQLGVPSTLSPGMRMTVTTLFARTPWQEVPDADA